MAGEAQVVTWKITWTKKQLPSQTALIGHKKSHFFFLASQKKSTFFWLARKSVSNMEFYIRPSWNPLYSNSNQQQAQKIHIGFERS